MKFMKNKIKNLFITHTRTDFGKLRLLIKILKTEKKFEFFHKLSIKMNLNCEN